MPLPIEQFQGARLIGCSDAIQRLQAELEGAAQSDAKVLISGETGVGKEVVARLVHRASRRAAAPLVTLNCAGLPDSLLESELFGHVRGGFTGAYRNKPGLLETAAHGTVFLDEVGEMSPRMQALLLRFLESGEIRRVGDHLPPTHVNARLITATNRDLLAEVSAERFRADLFFRLNVIRLNIPPLRERPEDIKPLADYFLMSYGMKYRHQGLEIDNATVRVLMAYPWPGNVRELRNVIERAVLRSSGRVVTVRDLPPEVGGSEAGAGSMPRLVAIPGTEASPEIDATQLLSEMREHGSSFWTVVYPRFMSRDLTRAELRQVIRSGLEVTRGSYRQLVEQFNMPPADYKRFLAFLRTHDCH